MPGGGPQIPFDWPMILTKDSVAEIKQNLKNVILTDPGEWIGNQIFGVGLKRYLFDSPSSFGTLQGRIRQQVGYWLPFIDILDVTMTPDAEKQRMGVKIEYFIKTFNWIDTLFLFELAKLGPAAPGNDPHWDIYQLVDEYVKSNESGQFDHFVPGQPEE